MTVEEAIAIVEQAIQQGHLSKVQKLVFRQAWEGRSYAEIAKESGYDLGYIKDTGSKLWQTLSEICGVKVTKLNFQTVLKRMAQRASPSRGATPSSTQADWGEAIDVSIFYGRSKELATLNQWIVRDRCRLVTLLGMGGMGKTSLSVKIAQQVQPQFECVIWRSLRDAPSLNELLTTLIRLLTPASDDALPEGSSKLSVLIERLRTTRTLVVLDNFDALLQSGQRSGTYCPGYEGYGELLKRVGEIAHQSCFLLTSREKPQEIAAQEGEVLPVRTWLLSGVDVKTGSEIVVAKGLRAAAPDLHRLVDHYRGNPLALKIATTSIQDLFAGDIARFLNQGSSAFGGISTLLQQQCSRLSPLEQQVMHWLAINREPVDCVQLLEDLIPPVAQRQLLEVLESLRWRGLIECTPTGFTQQPVIMEAVTEQIIERIAYEITSATPDLFSRHALIKAQVKDYIRESQLRLIVQPLVDRLRLSLGSVQQIEHQLNCLIVKLKQNIFDASGYGGGNVINLFRHLEIDITGEDFSGLSIRQAYLQDVSLHQVDFSAAQFDHCAFASTFGGVTSVNFSPDGEVLAISDTTGGIHLWRLADGQQLVSCEGHNSWVWQVVFSPTHPLLASCGQDHQVRLWERDSGNCLKVLTEHTGIVTSVAFNAAGTLLASTSGDHTIRIWDVATGTCQQVLQGHHACVWSAVFHPSGKTLFSAGEDNGIRIWDLETGACVALWTGHQHWIRAIALNPTATLLASASFDQTIKLWEVETGDCLDTLTGHHKTVTSVAFSAEGHFLASGSYDQTVKIWDVEAGYCQRTFQKHSNLVWSVAFHPQTALLASGGEDYTARLWELATGRCTKTWQGYSNTIYTVALHPSQPLLVSGHEDQTIKVWVASTAQSNFAVEAQPVRTLRGHTGRILSVAFSPTDSVLASASTDRTVKLWSTETGKVLQTFQDHTSWVWAVAFHPSGKWLASASYDQTVKLWDIETGTCQQTLHGHSGSALSVAFSPDGRWLASGGYDQMIKLWQVETGDCLYTWQAHLNRVWTVAFSPDSRWLATSGDDSVIQIWNVATGELAQTLSGNSSQILSVIFSPDGRTLYAGGADKTIHVWNLKTNTCTAMLNGHNHWVWALQHHPDLPLLISAGQDETIRSWSTETYELVQTRQAPRPYEGMKFTDATGLTEAQEMMLKALGATNS